jgi:alpha-beta hydrolase superfamily lysophospholipase
MSHETTSIDGTHGTIVVHVWTPEGDARAVVLLAHGFGEHAGRYAHVAAHLNARGIAVVAPDHDGHGLSDGERALVPDLETLVDDFARAGTLARETFPDVPLVILGHSLGGVVATRTVQRGLLPAAGLVLSGPVIGGNPDILALLDLDPIPDVPIDPAVLSRDPAVGEAYGADPLVYHGPFHRETLEALATIVPVIAEAAPIGALPTLYLHGEDDPLAPYAVTRPVVEGLGLSDLEQRSYPGARHEILNETNQDEVLADIDAFLDRVLG